MIKKKNISQEDINTWNSYIKSPTDITDKDYIQNESKSFHNRFKYDLHGFTLEEANQKMTSYIEECYANGVNKINVITGKGLRSKNLNDPYQSNNLSILKFSVPHFIKGNNQLMSKIISIDFERVGSISM